tara:strand:+ start:1457 stop:1681 length:225 start_codon:yes stop_codon:yes gene_type:complete
MITKFNIGYNKVKATVEYTIDPGDPSVGWPEGIEIGEVILNGKVLNKEPNTFLTKQILESVKDDMLWLFRRGEL